ncbi:MAG TPA: hypothetical protein ENJ09_10640 [Planctomycetes bacterium]|nr:hypothetical protein [Planctomycetota bacterium]
MTPHRLLFALALFPPLLLPGALPSSGHGLGIHALGQGGGEGQEEGRQELDPSRPDPASFMGRAFVYDVDLAFGRAAGWIGAGVGDEQALEEARAALEKRLRRSAYFTEARVLAEEGNRLAAVFVGRQDPAMEKFLLGGLSLAGHLAIGCVAEEGDFEGTSLAAERQRFVAWCGAHPEASAVHFDRVPREEGGPPERIRWRFPRGERSPERAVPLLADRRLDLTVADLVDGLLVATPVEEPRGAFQLQCTLVEEAKGELAELRASSRGHKLVICVDERVLGRLRRRSEDSHFDIVFPRPLPADAARVLVFAIAGGALPAPLSFVEFSKRRLLDVVQEGE